MLEHLGASPLEDELYRHLVTVPAATLPALAAVTGAGHAAVAGALSALRGRGLVGRGEGDPVNYVAAAPELAVEAMLREREAALRRARGELAELVDVHRSAVRARSASEIVEVVADPDTFHRRLLALMHSTQDEVMALVRPPFVTIGDEEARANRVRASSSRVIYERSILDTVPDVVALLRGESNDGARYRLHRDIPLKLTVFDRSTAVLPAVRGPESAWAMLIVHPGTLLDVLTGFFEYVWESAAPFPGLDRAAQEDAPGSVTPLDEVDRNLISLMLAGLTDQAIAGHLGIGLRSVQRRIHDLMARTGVQTRVQLGWHAAQQGWLSATRPIPFPLPGSGRTVKLLMSRRLREPRL